jgi:hypothetical protein
MSADDASIPAKYEENFGNIRIHKNNQNIKDTLGQIKLQFEIIKQATEKSTVLANTSTIKLVSVLLLSKSCPSHQWNSGRVHNETGPTGVRVPDQSHLTVYVSGQGHHIYLPPKDGESITAETTIDKIT